MKQLRHRHRHRPAARIHVKWAVAVRLGAIRRYARLLWEWALAFPLSTEGPRHRRLRSCFSMAEFEVSEDGDDDSAAAAPSVAPACFDLDRTADDADVLALKVSLLGDCQIGKTSFMVKYVGDVEEHSGLQMSGLNLMDKIVALQGARIAFSIWDVGGDQKHVDHVPIACKDAVAILIMFDLTSRQTLNNAIGWYQRARKWNKTAISILIGTKFDDYIQLPRDMQWTIIHEARAYAQAMKATLFFSSARHNINVNKIFKFITAKLFNLPWALERNLRIGEPVIDF